MEQDSLEIRESGSLDIEKIMEQIREEARALRYEEPVSFEEVDVPVAQPESVKGGDFRLKRFEETVDRMNAVWEIPYGHEIAGNPLKKLLARAVRKVNKPTGAPMAQDVTRFNAEVTHGINDVLNYIREAQKKAEEQERRIGALEAEVRQLREQAGKKA